MASGSVSIGFSMDRTPIVVESRSRKILVYDRLVSLDVAYPGFRF